MMLDLRQAACVGYAIPIARRRLMSTNTYKLVELVGSSPDSSDEAVRNALAKASATIKHMDWFQVVETRGHIVDGKVSHFQVTVKVGFRIED
jgi:dodecin